MVVHQFKQAHGGGCIEGVIWKVPSPVPPTGHGYKYRLVYVVAGERLVGYDNERGKGDHRHLGERELPFGADVVRVSSVGTLTDA
ncbi:MAG: hypothetical protein IPH73_14540 [Rhodocyclales bacterium]|nr:hypothetical protein [Rhodocyclales bacterium]